MAETPKAEEATKEEEKPKVEKPLKQDEVKIDDLDFEFILDIPLEVAVELGRARITIDGLLQLSPGSIVELNRLAGEPLDVFINRNLVGKGEVVVQNNNYAVRLTDLISEMERRKNLVLDMDKS